MRAALTGLFVACIVCVWIIALTTAPADPLALRLTIAESTAWLGLAILWRPS